jgi:hypothetical protein
MSDTVYHSAEQAFFNVGSTEDVESAGPRGNDTECRPHEQRWVLGDRRTWPACRPLNAGRWDDVNVRKPAAGGCVEHEDIAIRRYPIDPRSRCLMYSQSLSRRHDLWLSAAGLGVRHGAPDVQLSRWAAEQFARITAVSEGSAAGRHPRPTSAWVLLERLVGQRVAS